MFVEVAFDLATGKCFDYFVPPEMAPRMRAGLRIPQLLKLADWICEYYCATHERVIWNLLPAVVRKGEMQHKETEYIDLSDKAHDLGSPEFLALTPKRQLVIKTLVRFGGSLPAREALGAIDASKAGFDALFGAQYTVTAETDRMGCRLSGANVPFADGKNGNIVSDAVAFGGI